MKLGLIQAVRKAKDLKLRKVNSTKMIKLIKVVLAGDKVQSQVYYFTMLTYGRKSSTLLHNAYLCSF